MKRKRGEQDENMEIVWETLDNPPQRHDYIFREGIRYVRPYYFEFVSHGKNRWAGRTIVDLFADEFKGRDRDYYVSAVKAGRIQVKGEIVPVSYVVKSSEKISHFVHRHEPPVLARDIKILHCEPDVLTVYKPASVPAASDQADHEFLESQLAKSWVELVVAGNKATHVHPCGQYRKNTVTGILEAEHDLAPLFPIHRLDRLVSGLLIIARNPSKADFFRQQIESGEVKKQYIARVIGVFPENEQVVNANVFHNAREGKSTVEVENGSNGSSALKGKVACTKFTRISTNGTQSIILCEPITGRTHQIRVHLQFLGYPIANDMLYLSEFVPHPCIEGLRENNDAANVTLPSKFNHCEISDPYSTDENSEDFKIDAMCTNCPNLGPKGYDGHEDGLWLHCVRYSGPSWTYECLYPDWSSLS